MDDADANFGSGPWNDDLKAIPNVYLNGRGEFLVGEIDGELAAMGGLREIDGVRGEIKRMRVLPQFQRCGYGQQVLDALEARARQLGYEALELDTLRFQLAARAFYTKNGYEQFGTQRFKGEEQLLYRKRLFSTT